ncbi:MAG: putative rane protein [Eubacterium sp.]|nr:putative rane protein [Eubacterium sp.]
MWLINLLNNQADFYIAMILRLLAACLLGGIIGFEREHVHRPAGLRTHILVCVGSALVMITSEFIYYHYSSHVNVDPARLGAQVISGIGFLGAGTIIKEGISVKGLTTAASLWAVSCVGIAVGIGFYSGAIIATVIIFLILVVIKKTQSSERDGEMVLRFTLDISHSIPMAELIEAILCHESVRRVYEE